MTELVSAKKIPNSFTETLRPFEFILIEFEMDAEKLGISKRVYCSDFVRAEQEDSVRVISWLVLKGDVDTPLNTTLRKIIRSYGRRLRDDIKVLGLPLSASIAIVRPEREAALIEHLRRNNIQSSCYDPSFSRVVAS